MRNMEGKEYWHGKYGTIQVIKQPNYKAGGPRNVLIHTKAGGYYVVPQRSLRKKLSLSYESALIDISEEVRNENNVNR